MSEVAIRAEKLGKRYRLGERERYLALRDLLARSLRAPLRWFNGRASGSSSHGFIWALRDVSFEIKAGEVIGIIGRNGAGKSTLLKILARITKPTEGCAEMHGRIGSLLEVGTGFHPELTGRENVYLSGAILGMKKAEIERKFDEIVAFAEIEKFLDTPVKHYSSGMYVRLAFGVAAHLEPDILLVDEVLAVGDAAFQKKCLGKMDDVAKEGRTIFFVSHNMSALLNLCSRAFLLEDGKVATQGDIHRTVKQYLQNPQTSDISDLSRSRTRRGRGRVRFSRVWFEDERGHAVDQAISGETLVAVMQYESRLKDDLQNCRVSIAAEDWFGQPLFLCSTDTASNRPVILPPNGVVRCFIPRLPLSRGQYSLTLFLEANHEVEDWLLSALPLNVADGDFFGSGRQYPEGWQGKGVLVPHRWDMESRGST